MKYCFGADVGGTTIKLGLFTVDGEILDIRKGKKEHRFLILQRITANSFLHVRQRENVRAFLRQKQKKKAISY